MHRLLKIFTNKYVLSLIAFSVWMAFFDSNDVVSQYQHRSKLKALETERDYYINEIKRVNADLYSLSTDQNHLERFAREKYFMKRDEEDVYVIVKE